MMMKKREMKITRMKSQSRAMIMMLSLLVCGCFVYVLKVQSLNVFIYNKLWFINPRSDQ